MPISVLDSRPVQMNVRMDRQLKEAGDAVLAHIGMTPQSVNAFGGFTVSEGAALISNFYERFSIQRPSPDEAFDYDELYDQMMSERFSDWIEL